MGRGGKNQTHGTVERAIRLDSFQLSVPGSYTMRWENGSTVNVKVTADATALIYRLKSEEVRERLPISWVPNNYGGSRSFLICPGCWRRVRFLYLRWGRFRCRRCARLNYACQQATKDEFVSYDAAVKLLRSRFKVRRENIPVPMNLPHYVPPRPKGMHWATYWALLERFGALRNRYGAVFVSKAMAFLGRK